MIFVIFCNSYSLEGDVECSPKQGKTPRRPTSRGSQGRDKGGKRDKGDRRSQGSSESNNNHTPASSDMAFRDRSVTQPFYM